MCDKESWNLPTLAAGVMHNIEPAHHAVQQEVDWIGGRKSKQPVTRFVRVRGRDKVGG